MIVEAEDVAEKVGFLGTYEAMLVERLGHEVHIVESNYENVKMTTKEDLLFGEAILSKRSVEE
ncbi:2-C-methyl-D-erythritol 4-phosphate cytidylyltransferase OS=Lysinibacillus sphaericus OX=1421 GN=ispD PE=3 SV=1 [Lysinibacillus sphaericus]